MNAKLSDKDVLRLRADFERGKTSKPALARKYGISVSHVYLLLTRFNPNGPQRLDRNTPLEKLALAKKGVICR